MTAQTYVARRACALLYSFAQRAASGVWLLPANICPDVPATLLAAGRVVETIDLDPVHLCLDPSLVQERLQQGGVAAVVLVDAYGGGSEARATEWLAQANSGGSPVKVVWDRCLSYPPVGEASLPAGFDLVVYSTCRSKPLDLGYGGLAYSREVFLQGARPFDPKALEQWEEHVKQARTNGGVVSEQALRLEWLDLGRLDTGDYLHARHSALPSVVARRVSLNQAYRSILPQEACLPELFQDWRFNLLAHRADELVATIFSEGLWASRHYKDVSPLFGLPARPVTTRLSEHVVNLFSDHTFNLELVERTARLVARHLAKHGFPEWPWENGG